MLIKLRIDEKDKNSSTTMLNYVFGEFIFLLTVKHNQSRVLILQHAIDKDALQEKTSWYDKNGELTFTDIMMAVKSSILTEKYF